MREFIEILVQAAARKASDVHLRAAEAPAFRIHTALSPANLPPLSADTVAAMAKQLLGERRWAAFEQTRDADFSVDLPGVGRLRVNAHYQRRSIALSVRLIGRDAPPLDRLFLPPAVEQFTRFPHGLVLVTGPTGSGKSTTLAAMVEAINGRDTSHIVTLEDPIEYVFEDKLSLVEQREIGSDVPTFASGLRHALRQDPDVILVGEMRDYETISAAVSAAETGHLVLSSLHTTTAPHTIERIVDAYPAGQQGQIRSMLAGTLRAVVCQTLFRRADRPGMIPAAEVMVCTPAVRTCIRENRLHEIPNLIETGRSVGMQPLDHAIRQLHANGYVSRDDALAQASQPEKLGPSLAA